MNKSIKRSRSESRRAKLEESKVALEKEIKDLEDKKGEVVKSDNKMKFIHENMYELIKELEKSKKLKKEPCNL